MATGFLATWYEERTPAWRPLVIAMAKSGGGSIASGMLSAFATKIIAAKLGAPGVALVTTLQRTRDTMVVAATANGRVALVQGTSELTHVARREYLRTSLLIFAAGNFAAICILVLGRGSVAAWNGLPAASGGLFAWLAVPVVLTGAVVFSSALAASLGEIGRLAWSQVLVSAMAAATAWPVARLVGIQSQSKIAIVAWLFVTAVVSFALGLWTIARFRLTLVAWMNGTGRWWSWLAARRFFSISSAMLATGFLGSALLVALRARIIRAEGLEAAGLFDAAWTISMSHVSLVLVSLQTYYFPALARGRDNQERAQHVGRVLMATTLVMAPTVAVLEIARPWVLGFFFSASFRPSAELLRWTLIGDYLKTTSWVLGIPMLAMADMKALLASDFVGQVVFAAGALGLTGILKPSESTAVAFLISYAVNLIVCYGYVRRRLGFRAPWRLGFVWFTGLALVVAAAAATWRT